MRHSLFKRSRALHLLLEGKTVKEVARKLNLPAGTVNYWKQTYTETIRVYKKERSQKLPEAPLLPGLGGYRSKI